MKVEFSILTLILLVSCTAQEYELQCTRNELGILWPYYVDQRKYYECLNVGNPILRSCKPDTWFTFVYQMCTSVQEYIAPPPLGNLPTEKPPGGSNSTTPEPSTMTTCPPTTTEAPTTTMAPTTTKKAATTKSSRASVEGRWLL